MSIKLMKKVVTPQNHPDPVSFSPKKSKMQSSASEAHLTLGYEEKERDPYDEIVEEPRLLRQESQGLLSSTSEVASEIIFATQMTNAKSDYYLRGDPVSLVLTNIPSFKGGRANPWMESDTDLIALRDSRNQSIKRKAVDETFQK